MFGPKTTFGLVLVTLVMAQISGCKPRNNTSETRDIATGTLKNDNANAVFASNYFNRNFYREESFAGSKYIVQTYCRSEDIKLNDLVTQVVDSSAVVTKIARQDVEKYCRQTFSARVPYDLGFAYLQLLAMSKMDMPKNYLEPIKAAKVGSQEWITAINAAWNNRLALNPYVFDDFLRDRNAESLKFAQDEKTKADDAVASLENALQSLDKTQVEAYRLLSENLAAAKKVQVVNTERFNWVKERLAKFHQKEEQWNEDLGAALNVVKSYLQNDKATLITANDDGTYYSGASYRPTSPQSNEKIPARALLYLTMRIDDVFRWYLQSDLVKNEDFITIENIRKNALSLTTSKGTYRALGQSRPFVMSSIDAEVQLTDTISEGNTNVLAAHAATPFSGCKRVFGEGYQLPSYHDLDSDFDALVRKGFPGYYGDLHVWTADRPGWFERWMTELRVAVKLERRFVTTAMNAVTFGGAGGLPSDSLKSRTDAAGVICFKPKRQ